MIGIGVVGGAVVSTVVVGNAVVVSANIVTCAAFHCLILRKDKLFTHDNMTKRLWQPLTNAGLHRHTKLHNTYIMQ